MGLNLIIEVVRFTDRRTVLTISFTHSEYSCEILAAPPARAIRYELRHERFSHRTHCARASSTLLSLPRRSARIVASLRSQPRRFEMQQSSLVERDGNS